MRGTEVHEIKGIKYEFCLIPPMDALKILTRLIKRTLPSVGGALAGNSIKGMADALNTNVNLDSMAKYLADNLDEREVQDTVREILQHVRIQGRVINIELDFAGEIMAMLKVVYKALEVNFSDFIEGLKEKLVATIKKATSQPTFPSTGTSGGQSSPK